MSRGEAATDRGSRDPGHVSRGQDALEGDCFLRGPSGNPPERDRPGDPHAHLIGFREGCTPRLITLDRDREGSDDRTGVLEQVFLDDEAVNAMPRTCISRGDLDKVVRRSGVPVCISWRGHGIPLCCGSVPP